jgi:hypothetical protein
MDALFGEISSNRNKEITARIRHELGLTVRVSNDVVSASEVV